MLVILVSEGLRQGIEIDRLPLFVAPDIFHQIGVVDEGIAVALYPVDLDGSFLLFLAHGVHAVPLQEDVAEPRAELLPSVVGHGNTGFSCSEPCEAVAITCSNIEIGSCEVSFVFIRRAEDACQSVGFSASSDEGTVIEGTVGRNARCMVGFAAVGGIIAGTRWKRSQ